MTTRSQLWSNRKPSDGWRRCGWLSPTIAALFAAALFQADPTVVLGLVERDLTGDGKPEILRLVGVGPIDNLSVTFTIEDGGTTVYRFELAPLTRTVGFDAGRHVISAEEHRARVKEFGRWFFAENKFQRPDEFVARLGVEAPRRGAEIPDVIARDGRFYRLLECC